MEGEKERQRQQREEKESNEAEDDRRSDDDADNEEEEEDEDSEGAALVWQEGYGEDNLGLPIMHWEALSLRIAELEKQEEVQRGHRKRGFLNKQESGSSQQAQEPNEEVEDLTKNKPEVVQSLWVQPHGQETPPASRVLPTLGMQRWKGGWHGNHATDQQNSALEDWQLPKIEALRQERCWVETLRVIF